MQYAGWKNGALIKPNGSWTQWPNTKEWTDSQGTYPFGGQQDPGYPWVVWQGSDMPDPTYQPFWQEEEICIYATHNYGRQIQVPPAQ